MHFEMIYPHVMHFWSRWLQLYIVITMIMNVCSFIFIREYNSVIPLALEWLRILDKHRRHLLSDYIYENKLILENIWRKCVSLAVRYQKFKKWNGADLAPSHFLKQWWHGWVLLGGLFWWSILITSIYYSRMWWVIWCWFLCAVSDKWEDVSRDEVKWDIFAFVTSYIQRSALFDETTSFSYTVLSIRT